MYSLGNKVRNLSIVWDLISLTVLVKKLIMRTNIRFFEEEIGLRFLHLGNLHFGKIVNSFSMIEDQQYVLEQVKEYVKSINQMLFC